jgi:hypothetical protein
VPEAANQQFFKHDISMMLMRLGIQKQQRQFGAGAFLSCLS